MTPRQYLQATLSGLMAALAMLGSISGLVAFAAKGHAHVVTLPVVGYDLPLGMWAFVACLDGLTIVTALQVHDHERGMDWTALGTLVAVTVASAALQYLAAPDGWEAKVVYTAPAPLAGVATARFFRALGTRTKAQAKPKPKPKERSGGAATTPARPAPPAPPVEADVQAGPEPESSVTDIATARRAIDVSDDEIARLAAELLTAEGKAFSQRNWQAACKQVAGIGRIRAEQVRHLAPPTGT